MTLLPPDLEVIVVDYMADDLGELIKCDIEIPPQILRRFTYVQPTDYANIIMLPHGANSITASLYYTIPPQLLTDWTLYRYIQAGMRHRVIMTYLDQYSDTMVTELIYTEASHQRFPDLSIFDVLVEHMLNKQCRFDSVLVFKCILSRRRTGFVKRLVNHPNFVLDPHTLLVAHDYRCFGLRNRLIDRWILQNNNSLLYQVINETPRLLVAVLSQIKPSSEQLQVYIDAIPLNPKHGDGLITIFRYFPDTVMTPAMRVYFTTKVTSNRWFMQDPYSIQVLAAINPIT